MPEPTLDWSTAEVKDSTLTVQVEGELPDGWADTFNTTVKLLGGGSWGEIKLEEQKAEVDGLTPGTEEKLKHFLESVVQQANASHAPEEEDEQDEDEEGEEQKGEGSDKDSDSDKEMSERFQSFAKDEDSKDKDSKGEDKDDDDSKDKDSKDSKDEDKDSEDEDDSKDDDSSE